MKNYLLLSVSRDWIHRPFTTHIQGAGQEGEDGGGPEGEGEQGEALVPGRPPVGQQRDEDEDDHHADRQLRRREAAAALDGRPLEDRRRREPQSAQSAVPEGRRRGGLGVGAQLARLQEWQGRYFVFRGLIKWEKNPHENSHESPI